MTVLAQIKTQIDTARNASKPLEAIKLPWRQRYRLMVELQRKSWTAKMRHWRYESAYDQELAQMAYSSRMMRDVQVFGVRIEQA